MSDDDREHRVEVKSGTAMFGFVWRTSDSEDVFQNRLKMARRALEQDLAGKIPA